MFIFLFLFSLLQSSTSPCQVRLETHAQDGMLTVTGHCRNLTATPERYRYELTLRRESNGNLSQNTQRGEFAAAAQEEVSLSQTRVNAGPQDGYRIYLRVFDLAGRTLAQDSVVQTPTH